ncbi:MAG TPA: phospholipid carrier-dependent glycosyltransferase, partial [Candidatus Bathyarchaeia archaeon]|nr:phospholipid carrier-dependent glycosyltransferase [Candidatus Bathyarchaeia archaeon]
MSLLPRSTVTARAASLAVLAAALIVGTIVRWTAPRQVADLDPRPDALEYEEGARNLVRGEGYCLIVEGKKYPPRYPFGFSLLLAPFLAASGDAPGTGIWAVLACAWVAIVASWWLGWLAGGPWSAAAAALLLSLSGLHVAMSRAVMSDAPSAAITAALGAASIVALGRSTPGVPPGRGELLRWLALGVAAGLAASMRATNLLLLAPIACLLALERGCARRSRIARFAALSSGVMLGVLPLLLYNHARFGSPFATGYGFWVPAQYFDAKYVWGPAFQAVDRADEANLPFYARALFGGGTMYPQPIAIMVVLGAALSLARSSQSRRVAVVGLGFGAALLVVHLVFFWQSERF